MRIMKPGRETRSRKAARQSIAPSPASQNEARREREFQRLLAKYTK